MIVQDWLGKDNQLGIDIYEKKYRFNNESFDEFIERISGGDKELAEIILAKKFLFGGRILSNRNKEPRKGVTYSNCYVIAPPEDSIESIYDTRLKLARTYSYGGGCGIDISKLAPKGAKVNNQAKQTSGAVSFMEGYSQTTAEIGQNGRRGALMISISCDHPDLIDFIKVKTQNGAVTKANISVRVTDAFMNAVEQNLPWEMSFERPETGELITSEYPAKEIYHMLCEANWNWAEPGLLFWDNICNYNLLDNNPYFEYAGTNPCAEEPLPAYGSCLLGSINLSEFVINPFTEDAIFDLEDFEKTVKIAVRGLNQVLDEGLPLHPLKEQRECVDRWRQIGCGLMGLADCLIKLGIKYGSEESLDFIDLIGSRLAQTAILTSSKIAEEQGCYKGYNNDVLQSSFLIEHETEEIVKSVLENGLRNSQLLTCAPTGSIATMLNISTGVEPLFARSWTRKTESLHGEDVYYTETPKVIGDLMAVQGVTVDNLPDYVTIAHEIAPLDRVKVQGALQKHIDASISSTINLDESATVEDIENIYMEAWKNGLKGITIYRDNCMRSGILTAKAPEEKEKEKIYKYGRGDIITTSNDAIGLKRKLMTGCGSLHCAAFFDPDTGDLVETYLSKGSTGGCNNFMIGLSRMISLAARGGVKLQDIIDQLDSCGSCPSYAVRSATKHDTSRGSCCPMAVGNALKEMYEEVLKKIELSIDEPEKVDFISAAPEEKPKPKKVDNDDPNLCPECGSELTFEGGCNICKNCGWSKCD